MKIQYAKFTTLVLPFYAMGRIPIYPFDTSNGVSNDDLHNVFYHYHPAVAPVLFNNIGYAVSHYADNDSRFVCCLSCSDDVYGMSPDILIDAIEMGMAAWGGKVMTPEEALRMARYLQPGRKLNQVKMDDYMVRSTYRITIPEITINSDCILGRENNTEELI